MRVTNWVLQNTLSYKLKMDMGVHIKPCLEMLRKSIAGYFHHLFRMDQYYRPKFAQAFWILRVIPKP